MQFSIPTNWQPDLIEALKTYPIKELFGSLPQTPVGSGRPAMFLPHVRRNEAAEHIQQVVDAGFAFNYLVNGMCVDTADVSAVERQLVEHLAWVQDIGVTIVTAAHPLVLRIIKNRFPGLRVKVSLLPDFDTVGKLIALEEMGADEIALSIMYNRDFDFLQTAIQSTQCDLTLLVNQACLYMCAHRLNHGATNAHASREGGAGELFGLNYCLIKCSKEKLTTPSALIRSRWIRPEDIPVYEGMGFKTFKLAGREMSTEWIVNAVRGYSRYAYDGNLSDLLNGIAVMMGKDQKNRRLPLIDNRKLEGFIDHFTAGRCSGNCEACRHCERVAARAVDLYRDENAEYVNTLSVMMETML